MANLTCEQRLLNKGKHSLWLSGNLHNTSRTLNKANSRLKNSKDFYLTGNTLLDLRLKYDYNRMLLFSLDCDNVFDTNYEIGGTSYHPYQYPCRMLMGTISLSL
jgi:outer membrane receptor for ferric coprogen and ferric-rhodotorulic acid